MIHALAVSNLKQRAEDACISLGGRERTVAFYHPYLVLAQELQLLHINALALLCRSAVLQTHQPLLLSIDRPWDQAICTHTQHKSFPLMRMAWDPVSECAS